MATARKLLTVFGLILALSALGSVHQTHAQSAADTAAVDAAWKQAFISGDLDALLATYSDDIVDAEPPATFRGKAEVRGFLNAFLQQNPGFSVSFSESAIVLDTAIHRSYLTSDTIKAAGVSRIVIIATKVVYQGKIVTFTGRFDLSDPETARFLAAMAGGS